MVDFFLFSMLCFCLFFGTEQTNCNGKIYLLNFITDQTEYEIDIETNWQF